MSKWRLQKCGQRFLCMSVWRCRPASHQISCICLHLLAAVSLVSAALLQRPNTEPADLSGCLSSLFFLIPCAFSHLSAARSSSCIPPAVASLYKCLPPLLPPGPCVTVTFDKSRGERHFPFAHPFDWWCSHQWLFPTERLSEAAQTHRRVPQPHTVGRAFLFSFFFFFYIRSGTLCDTRLMAYWICHYSPVLFCHSWEN